MTDYFEHDRIRVEPDDMHYAKVKEALGYQAARAKWYADKSKRKAVA